MALPTGAAASACLLLWLTLVVPSAAATAGAKPLNVCFMFFGTYTCIAMHRRCRTGRVAVSVVCRRRR